MSNMSYCRFRNTLDDLRDCNGYLEYNDLSKEEHEARAKLIVLAMNIVEDMMSNDVIYEDETGLNFSQEVYDAWLGAHVGEDVDDED